MKTYTWEYKEIPNKFDGWQTAIIRTLYTVMLKASNELVIDNPGLCGINFAIEADAATVAALQQLPQFVMNENVDYESNPQNVGVLGRYNVVRNIEQAENFILVKMCGVKDEINYIYMARIDVKGLEKIGS